MSVVGTKGDILIADDERNLLVALTITLQDAGYAVRSAKDGETALKLFAERRPDLVLLDVMMPRMDGFAVCRKIRETDAETPVLFLTALGDERSQLEGFGCGADDYIHKSLSEPLFLSRVAAALRRFRPPVRFRFGKWSVRADEFSMTRDDGRTCPLRDREIALLRLLSRRPNEVLSREFLFAQCWGSGAEGSDGALNVMMSGLREKLREDGEKIVTLRGVGYVYRP